MPWNQVPKQKRAPRQQRVAVPTLRVERPKQPPRPPHWSLEAEETTDCSPGLSAPNDPWEGPKFIDFFVKTRGWQRRQSFTKRWSATCFT